MDNKDNSTTIGGVTFGGTQPVSNNPAPNSEQNANPANSSSQPVENETTSAPATQETPASAQNTSAKNNVSDTFTALENSDIEQILNSPVNNPFSTTPVPNAPEPVVPTQTSLNVPFVSPTSFDNSKTVNPVVKDPSLNNLPAPIAPEKVKKTKAPETTEESLKKFTTLSIVMSALAIVFLIVGIVGIVMALTQGDKLATTEAALKNKTAIVDKVEESTGVTISSPEDVPVFKATTGYIYIGDWNIKIKISDDLEYVSYILDQNYRPSICFNAVGKGVQYFPDFANIKRNPGKMGCLMRVATSEGSFDAASSLSFGELVFTYKDYNYFYSAGTDYSNPETDSANLGLEHTAMQSIKNMLRDNVEPYE